MSVKTLADIHPHRLKEIAEFFRSYKNLEKRLLRFSGWEDVEAVQALVTKSIEAALPKF